MALVGHGQRAAGVGAVLCTRRSAPLNRSAPCARSRVRPRPVRRSGATTLRGARSPAALPIAWPRGSPTRWRAANGADQTARIAAPATRCNDVARIGQFRHFAGSMSFVTTPRGLYRQARTADHSPRPTSARWCSNSASKANSPQNQRAGTKNRVFLEGDRLEIEVKGGPLGPMPCARPAGGAQTGAALLPRRRVTAQQRPGTALRCAVTSGVEAGNGVADEEAERLGGASQTGRRCLRVALAGNLSNRAPDARAYAQSESSPRFSLRARRWCPEPFDTREGRSSAPTPPSDQAPPPAPAGIRADSSRRR